MKLDTVRFISTICNIVINPKEKLAALGNSSEFNRQWHSVSFCQSKINGKLRVWMKDIRRDFLVSFLEQHKRPLQYNLLISKGVKREEQNTNYF